MDGLPVPATLPQRIDPDARPRHDAAFGHPAHRQRLHAATGRDDPHVQNLEVRVGYGRSGGGRVGEHGRSLTPSPRGGDTWIPSAAPLGPWPIWAGPAGARRGNTATLSAWLAGLPGAPAASSLGAADARPATMLSGPSTRCPDLGAVSIPCVFSAAPSRQQH